MRELSKEEKILAIVKWKMKDEGLDYDAEEVKERRYYHFKLLRSYPDISIDRIYRRYQESLPAYMRR